MTHASDPGRALGFERMLFFSDAVLAIAITLLVLEIRLPAPINGVVAFEEVVPKLVGYAISFYVISLYWLAHHRLFETVAGYDRPLLRANLAFLASIAFLPFPTSVIAEHAGQGWAVIFYALSLALAGAMLMVLTVVSRRAAVVAPGSTQGFTWRLVIRSLAAPLVFAVSALIALHDPVLAMWFWLSALVVVPLAEWLGRVTERRMDNSNLGTITGSN